MAYLPGCNFKCEFCSIRNNPFMKPSALKALELPEILRQFQKSLAVDRSVLITGGEPSMRPRLLGILAETAKEMQSEVIIDSNGSRPEVLWPLIADNLVDQIGIGLKGVTRDEAKLISGTNNGILAWDNPMKLVRQIVKDKPRVRVYITFVLNASVTDDRIRDCFNLFNDVAGKIYLKFNTVMDPTPRRPFLKELYKSLPANSRVSFKKFRLDYRESFLKQYYAGVDLEPISEADLFERVTRVAKEFPCWKDRVCLIPGEPAIFETDAVIRL